jgi:DNA-binding NtrC family response regulator
MNTPTSLSICIVDDVEENAKLIERVLAAHSTVRFADPEEALEYLRDHAADILVVDQKMPGISGIELIKRVRAFNRDAIAVVVSAYTDADDLIKAVNSNLIFRYVVKPFSVQELRDVVAAAADRLGRRRTEARINSELAIQNRLLLEENDTLRAGAQPILDLFAGGDPAMAKIKELALRYALSDAPVLITGETGTGKELLARIVHHFSPRRDKPFVAVNCSNLGEHLLESTLFGHARGAFTGADKDKPGLVQDAHTGTLFLDEIGDLPPHLQPRILRFAQFQTFTPVGSNKELHVDVRIVSATHQNLRSMTEAGDFRTDLYYRLNTLQIHLPPLRQRRQDIIPIMRRVARASGVELPPVDDGARRFLETQEFRGNVRELQNIVHRLLLLVHHEGVEKVTEDLVRTACGGNISMKSPSSLDIPSPEPGELVNLRDIVTRVENSLIRTVLAQENGNITQTARRLGLSRQGLRNKLDAMQESEPEELQVVHGDD